MKTTTKNNETKQVRSEKYGDTGLMEFEVAGKGTSILKAGETKIYKVNLSLLNRNNGIVTGGGVAFRSAKEADALLKKLSVGDGVIVQGFVFDDGSMMIGKLSIVEKLPTINSSHICR